MFRKCIRIIENGEMYFQSIQRSTFSRFKNEYLGGERGAVDGSVFHLEIWNGKAEGIRVAYRQKYLSIIYTISWKKYLIYFLMKL